MIKKHWDTSGVPRSPGDLGLKWGCVLNSEAFAAWLPAFGVPASYAVAITYVLVDTVDKGIKAYAAAKKELDDKASLHPDVDTPRCVLGV